MKHRWSLVFFGMVISVYPFGSEKNYRTPYLMSNISPVDDLLFLNINALNINNISALFAAAALT
jgi:hypothetical protein